MTDPAPAIYGALVDIQNALGKVEKSGRGPSSQGSYPFLPVDEIVARLAPLFSEYGVAVIPRQVSAEQQVFRFPKVNMQGDPVHDGRPDAVQLITRLQYDFDFCSREDGSVVTATSFGESIDTGDKGIRRAATAAYKEVLLRLFTVVAGEDDPDGQDPNDQPAQVVRQTRGEQQRERAEKGPTERAARPPRASRAKKDETPAVEPEVAAYVESVAQKAAPAEAAVESARTDAAPADPAPAVPAERPSPESASTATREEKTPAEQRSDDWKPDPEDVAHAEANAPKAREPKAPVEQPAPKTTEDERYNSVADVRKAIREQLEARGLDRSVANDIGDAETGKARGAWFANLSDLRKVLVKIEELPFPDAPAADPGF